MQHSSRRTRPVSKTIFSIKTEANQVECLDHVTRPSSALDKTPSVVQELASCLFQDPAYRYVHTISFLKSFTPEAEARIMENFERSRTNMARVSSTVIASAKSFKVS